MTSLFSEDVIKLFLAILIGGLIGLERELRDKAAGFRTMIFICLGSTLFTIVSLRFTIGNNPLTIIAGIVTGVGFLGAGVIVHDHGRVFGMTTAASIWLTAAMGITIGGGHYAITFIATLFVLIVLLLFPKFEGWLSHLREERTYEIIYFAGYAKSDELNALTQRCKLSSRSHRCMKWEHGGISIIHLVGKPDSHTTFKRHLFNDNDIKEFHFV